MPKAVKSPSLITEAAAFMHAARNLLRPIADRTDPGSILAAEMPDGLRVLLASVFAANEYVLQAHARILWWQHQQSAPTKKAWAKRRDLHGEAELAAAVKNAKSEHPRLGRRALAQILRAADPRWQYVTDEDVRRILSSGSGERPRGNMSPEEVAQYARVFKDLPEVHRGTVLEVAKLAKASRRRAAGE